MALEAVFQAVQPVPMPFHFWSGVFFVLGCTVGSFLNVVIHRLPLGQSIVSPPSHCPHCNYAIPWYLNIPLVTWVWLRGKCRNCAAPISFRYFAVELATGLVFLICWLAFGHQSPALAVAYSVFLSGLLSGSVIDHEQLIIPDEITYGGIGGGLLASMCVPALQGAQSSAQALMLSILGAGIGGGMIYTVLRLGKLAFGRHRLKMAPDSKVVFTETGLWLNDEEIPYDELFYRQSDFISINARQVEMIDRGYTEAIIRLSPDSLRIGEDVFSPEDVPHLEAVAREVTLPREAMGLGDVKLMAAIGAFLGWQATIFSLFGSAVLGTVGAVIPYLLWRGKRSRQVAYVPYISVAAVIWIFWGPQIFSWILTPRGGAGGFNP